jgi:hypothetical protein
MTLKEKESYDATAVIADAYAEAFDQSESESEP